MCKNQTDMWAIKTCKHQNDVKTSKCVNIKDV